MSSEPRHALIDALKAIISQIIVLHHLAFYGPMSDYAAPLAPELFAWLSQYARVAVQTFLVVGGFLAAQSLARDGTLVARPLGQLLGKRFLKLVPPYLAALALALVGAAIARQLMAHDSIPEAPSLGQLLTHLVLLHGHFGFDGLSAGVWYIGIDFQLYALLCLTLWLAARAAHLPAQAAHLGRALVMALLAASLFVFNRAPSLDNWAIYFVGAYGLGAMAYWGVRPGRVSPEFLLAVAIAVAALALDFRSRIAMALVVALLLALSRFQPRLAAWPSSSLIGWLGKVSYSVFLVHFPVCLVVNGVFERFVPHTPWLQLLGIVLAWGASLAVGALFHRHVELAAQGWWHSPRATPNPAR